MNAHLCAGTKRPEEDTDPLLLGLKVVVSLRLWEPFSKPLEEQPSLLTTKLSLQLSTAI